MSLGGSNVTRLPRMRSARPYERVIIGKLGILRGVKVCRRAGIHHNRHPETKDGDENKEGL